MEINDETLDLLFNETASKTIKKYREEANMSLEDVVAKMKNPVSRQMLFKYENNLARMKNKVFIDICNALNINPDEIFYEINSKSVSLANQLSNQIGQEIDIPLINKDTKEVVYGTTYHPDELELLFDKHKDILTDSDKTLIKTIIEQRKKEIDKELDGE